MMEDLAQKKEALTQEVAAAEEATAKKPRMRPRSSIAVRPLEERAEGSGAFADTGTHSTGGYGAVIAGAEAAPAEEAPAPAEEAAPAKKPRMRPRSSIAVRPLEERAEGYGSFASTGKHSTGGYAPVIVEDPSAPAELAKMMESLAVIGEQAEGGPAPEKAALIAEEAEEAALAAEEEAALATEEAALAAAEAKTPAEKAAAEEAALAAEEAALAAEEAALAASEEANLAAEEAALASEDLPELSTPQSKQTKKLWRLLDPLDTGKVTIEALEHASQGVLGDLSGLGTK